MLIKNICYLFIFTLVVSSEIYAEIIEVNFIYVGQKDHAALLGVKQGLDESNLQGQFLNQKYNLDIIAGNEFSNHGFAKYIAVLAALNTEEFTKLTRQLANTPVFNLANGSDGLRRNCINNALHIIPSNKMKADALEQWQTKNSDSKAKAQAWHYSFIKFAARDLNKRFKKNHKAKMDDYSWAGWAAVKMLSDTVARTQIITAKNMLHYLKTELSFDGQKGSDMNFRVTGQLRQLVLLIENDKVVAEAPVRGVAKPPSLDSLGIVECSK